MQQPVLNARVLRFAHDHGFGSVLLDDGRVMPFDVSVCTREPSEGDEAKITLGRGRSDQLKVTYLEPLSDPSAEVGALPVRAAIMRLHAVGLAIGLSFERLQELVDEHYLGEEDEADIMGVLSRYYASADRAALADGWFACEWKFQDDTDDICAELSARIGAPALLSLVSWSERESDEIGYVERIATLHARRSDGREVKLDVRSVLDVVTLFNEALAERADTRRFRSLETDSDGYAFLLLESGTHDELRRWRVLPFQRS